MDAQVDAQLRRELREIVELDRQAEALCVEHRYARAAKRCAAAVERARALAALGENSVVVAHMKSYHARVLLCLVEARVAQTEPLPATGNDMDTGAAAEQALELLLAAVSAIRHRRAAGTLLRGTCRAVEVAHSLAERDATIAVGELTAEDLPISRAAEVGEYASAAVGATALMALGLCSQAPVQTFLSDAHHDVSSALGVFASYVRETLDMVAALPSDGATAGIVAFAERCEWVIGTVLEHVCAHNRDTVAGGTPMEAHAASILVEQLQPLCDAWTAHGQFLSGTSPSRTLNTAASSTDSASAAARTVAPRRPCAATSRRAAAAVAPSTAAASTSVRTGARATRRRAAMRRPAARLLTEQLPCGTFARCTCTRVSGLRYLSRPRHGARLRRRAGVVDHHCACCGFTATGSSGSSICRAPQPRNERSRVVRSARTLRRAQPCRGHVSTTWRGPCHFARQPTPCSLRARGRRLRRPHARCERQNRRASVAPRLMPRRAASPRGLCAAPPREPPNRRPRRPRRWRPGA